MESKKPLRYHFPIRWLRYPFLVFVFIFSLFALLSTSGIIFTAFFSPDNTEITPTIAVISASMILGSNVILVLLYQLMIKRAALSKIYVHGDHFLIQRGKVEIIVPYREIKAIKSKMTMIGGWFTVRTHSKGNYHFGRTLEGADSLLDSILSFNSSLLEPKKLRELKISFISNDRTIERCCSLFKKDFFRIGYFHFIGMPILFSIGLLSLQKNTLLIHSKSTFLWASFSEVFTYMYFIFLLGFFPFTYYLNRNVRENLRNGKQKPERDLNYERGLLKKLLPIYTLLITGLFYVSLKIGVGSVGLWISGDHYTFLGVKPFESLTLDRRYNCLECAFPIQQGDLVLVSDLKGKEHLAKVIEIPQTPQIERYPAQAKKPQSIKNPLLLQVGTDDFQMQTYPVQSIRGKLHR
jgi:hypothetical protein